MYGCYLSTEGKLNIAQIDEFVSLKINFIYISGENSFNQHISLKNVHNTIELIFNDSWKKLFL